MNEEITITIKIRPKYIEDINWLLSELEYDVREGFEERTGFEIYDIELETDQI